MTPIQPCKTCGEIPNETLQSILGAPKVSLGCCEIRTSHYKSRRQAIKTWNRWQTGRRQLDLPDAPRIGYDIDGVLANFTASFIKRAKRMDLGDKLPGHSVEWSTYTPQNTDAYNTVWEEIEDDVQFWMDIDPYDQAYIHTGVQCYITSRPALPELTVSWIATNGFPPAPVYSVGDGNSKLSVADEEDLDLFVDDKPEVVRELTTGGIPCLLRDRPYNRNEGLEDLRIRSLAQAPHYL